jgi:hypothetical protein
VLGVDHSSALTTWTPRHFQRRCAAPPRRKTTAALPLFFVQNEFSMDRRPFPPTQTPPSSIARAASLELLRAEPSVLQTPWCSVSYRSIMGRPAHGLLYFLSKRRHCYHSNWGKGAKVLITGNMADAWSRTAWRKSSPLFVLFFLFIKWSHVQLAKKCCAGHHGPHVNQTAFSLLKQ